MPLEHIYNTQSQTTQEMTSNITINNNNQQKIIYYLCDKIGHKIKFCLSRPKPSTTPNWIQVNIMTTSTVYPSNQIINSETSHYIIFYLQNLSIYIDYRGNEDIIINDGNRIPITCISSTILILATSTFTLDNILCVPRITRNLISIPQFYK